MGLEETDPWVGKSQKKCIHSQANQSIFTSVLNSLCVQFLVSFKKSTYGDPK